MRLLFASLLLGTMLPSTTAVFAANGEYRPFLAPAAALDDGNDQTDNDGNNDAGAPVDQLEEGMYLNPRGYFDRIEIAAWADELIVTGLINYGGFWNDFEVALEHVEGNEFKGSGDILAHYGPQTCRYPIALEVMAYEGGLYLKSRNPDGIPMSAPIGACYPAGVMRVYRHPGVYAPQDQGE
jgi:hypothetical protein